MLAVGTRSKVVALSAALSLVTSFGGVSSNMAAASVSSCDLSAPTTCTLREVASLAGLRVGATLEPDNVGPGQYATTLATQFNSLTPENALKLYTVQPQQGQWNFGPADAVVDFAQANDMAVRGHTLVWAQDAFTPAWTKAITDPAQLRPIVNEYIAAVMGRYAGRIHRYDVVNEPLQTLGTGPSDSVFWNLGPDWVADAFRYAHTIDPTAELWLNETATDWLPEKHDALLAFVRALLVDGVPIHGVGIQTHRVPGLAIDQNAFEQQLRDFADLGLKVAITELDVPVVPADPDAFSWQADEYRKVIHACIAVHGCEEVTTWGVTDAQTWLDGSSPWLKPTRPLLFDTSFQPKPAYFAVRNAIAANARDVLAAPNREVAVTWSAADDARLVEIAMHLGVTPEQVQKIAVYFLALLVSYLPPGQLPVTIQPSGTHTTRLNSWSAAETGVLDAVSTKFVLDDSTATRLSAHVLSFLFALGGN